ncbi:TetR/AcrR family transcriptional regulator [Amycolatopsis sp. NPDC021455]|uniref:TetR/AcrR family transcriptional regulator n=1 Tax=Amycolatopsis sp. NPDC021455 TaxID=3154901 RepID=UPI0033D045F8
MPELPEHSSPKAARILAAAGELLLARGSKGVTIADVATRAHIGKGTVYLYWKTKEDLLLGLVGRDFLALADDVTEAVTADPDLARPSRLVPDMLNTATRHPFVEALRSEDGALLGALTDDPRSRTLLDTLSPDALMYRVLPIWRRHGLARTDWSLAEQGMALHALLTGFLAAPVPNRFQPEPVVPGQVLAKSVTALLGPEHATPDQVRATAAEGLGALAAARATVLEFIAAPALI